jgi:hypothetical protein
VEKFLSMEGVPVQCARVFAAGVGEQAIAPLVVFVNPDTFSIA